MARGAIINGKALSVPGFHLNAERKACPGNAEPIIFFD
jgi:hypothetical protein